MRPPSGNVRSHGAWSVLTRSHDGLIGQFDRFYSKSGEGDSGYKL